MRNILSVDLGTVNDYTAITMLEVVSRFQEKGRVIIPGEMKLPVVNEIVCRYIERVELGTSYPDIIERIRVIMDSPDITQQTVLVVDQTGCGIPVIQQMRMIPGLSPVGITITGGNTVSSDGNSYNVPKRDLVSALQLAFQTRRLKFSKGLDHVDDLVHELRNFKVKQKKNTESYESWRESDHDDIVLSIAMGVWMIRRFVGETTQMDKKVDENKGYNVLSHGIQRKSRKVEDDKWARKG